MAKSVGSSKLASENTERGSYVSPTIDIPLSVVSQTDATIEMVLTVYRTNVEECGAHSEGPPQDDIV